MALIWTCESSDAVPADPIFPSPYLVLNDMTADEGGHPLAIGDVNGDQAPDLVLIGSHSDVQPTVRVYLGDGYGNFLKPVISNPLNGRHPWAAVLADFNLDHKLDLALCARSDTVVYVFPGRGDGTFDPAVATGVGARVNSLSVGDMNEDHVPDLVTSQETGGIGILLGNGAGGFTVRRNQTWSHVHQAVLTDMNLDGHLDVVVDSDPVFYLGDGTGGIPAFQGTVSPGSGGVLTVADLDGDQRKDIFGIDENGRFHYRYAGPAGQFERSFTGDYSPPARSMVTRDFDGDGRPEFVVASNGIQIYTTNSQGRLDLRQTLPSPPPGFNAAVLELADLNQDGRPDIVAAFPSAVAIYFGGPNGTFPVGQPYVLSSRPGPCASGDFWGIGRSSIATILAASDSVAVLSVTPDGTTVREPGSSVGHGPSAIACTDMNHDLRPDIVVANALSGTITVLSGLADHSWQRTDWPAVPGMVWLAIDDVDGDGRADIATNGNDGQIHVLRGLESGFDPPVAVASGAGQSATFANLNGDADPDLAIRSNNWLGFLEGGSGLSFLPRPGLSTSNSPYPPVPVVRTIDIDHDATSDLLVSQFWGYGIARETSSWWFSGPGVSGGLADQPTADVASADLDGDGWSDIVTTASGWPLAGANLRTPTNHWDFCEQATWVYGFGSTGLEHVLVDDVTGDVLPDLIVTDPDVNGIWVAPHVSAASTGVVGHLSSTVARVGCAPNPISGSARIRYELPSPGRVRLAIVDVRGRVLRHFPERVAAAGALDTSWDGNDDRGTRVRPGVYYVRLEINGNSASGKVVVL